MAAALALPGAAAAQERAGDGQRLAAVTPPMGPQKPRDIHAELDAIAAQIRVTDETLSRLRQEAESIAADRRMLSASLVESAATQEKLTLDLGRLEDSLVDMTRREGLVRASLATRNRVLTDLLGAMQRLGRSPPPALLVQPADALSALRSAMMLGTVVPQVRAQSTALADELTELERLTRAIEADKALYTQRLAARRQEDARIESLIARRKLEEASSRASADGMRVRAEQLAARATSLEGLIAALDAASAPADLPQGEADETYDISLLRQKMKKMQADAAFSTLKGLLNPPVAGALAIAFGADDAAGRPAAGVSFEAMPGDLVMAPCDAEILYSGPFRSYGQLLILNAGDGYHIVLAGMAEIDVDVGQFVLANEPVARMGARRLAGLAGTEDPPGGEPALYVEFRKDGQPVDPSPWWAERLSGRTRNDS